ncbi:MAG: CoA pyrophosphatase [Burkholderiaceae bacterium]
MAQFDPETVPLDRDFGLAERGAAVAPVRLVPDALRQRFAAPPLWTPELSADSRLLLTSRPERPAAVLVPMVDRPTGITVLLTRRTDHLHDHAGQISFPGGRRDAVDTSAVATALRETEEEIGLARSRIDVLGHLPDYLTVTGYRVTPVVALVSPPFELRLDSFEVAEAFEVPLAYLMDPVHHQRRRIDWGDQARSFYAMPWQSERRYFIWGATAAMLRNLYRFLAA